MNDHAADHHAAIDLRHGLHLLSRGLIAYGIVGLVALAVGFGALVWVNGRLADVGREVDATVERLVATTDQTSTALRDTSRSARSFSATLGQAADALPAAAAQIGTLRSDLTALEGQLRSVNILGTTPLSSAADAVSRIVASTDGLDTQLSIMGIALTANSDALGTNAESLGRLGETTASLATRLGSGVVQTSLDDIQLAVDVVVLVMLVLFGVPAVGALVVGLWLRRLLTRVTQD